MKINFEIDTEYGKFSDALSFEDDAIPDEATIESMKQERLANWVTAITTPPASVPEYQLDENGEVVLDANGEPILIGVN